MRDHRRMSLMIRSERFFLAPTSDEGRIVLPRACPRKHVCSYTVRIVLEAHAKVDYSFSESFIGGLCKISLSRIRPWRNVPSRQFAELAGRAGGRRVHMMLSRSTISVVPERGSIQDFLDLCNLLLYCLTALSLRPGGAVQSFSDRFVR